MPDETPTTPPSPETPAAQPAPPQPGPGINIGEEFGTAEKKLPPVKIVLIGLAIVVVVATVTSLLQRARSFASGSIDDVVAAEIPNQNSVLVAIAVSVQNHGKKPFWVHNIEAELQTGSGNFSDEAASAVDFPRYFQALPALKEHALAPFKRESMIEPGGEAKGTIIVSFPVTQDAFNSRQSLKVTIRPYDQPVPLVLTR